ncbi:MAG TPA: alpha/beta hydrolase [Burkholderiaceae bacterium]|nr:alpha/beta hydrolase [Burkholderiaceae bacterium]HQR71756.1 alpha/beta hydrolase [Burkholderiaceae bacterium]
MDLLASPRLYAYTGGRPFDPARPTVVFLHGAQHDHSVWILQSRFFAHHGYSVLALDLPGHMRSEGPALTSVEATADRVTQGLTAGRAQRLLLVGHSMGSLLALEVARRLPERVAGVALVATAFPMRVSDTLLAATRADPSAALDMINVWSHSAAMAAFERKPSNPGPGFSNVWQNLRLMQRIARRDGPEVLVTDFAACNAYAGGIEAARALRCPALFVLGDQDVMTPPKAAQSLIDATPDSTVVRVAGGGHSLMSERPDAVLKALTGFAARIFASAATA